MSTASLSAPSLSPAAPSLHDTQVAAVAAIGGLPTFTAPALQRSHESGIGLGNTSEEPDHPQGGPYTMNSPRNALFFSLPTSTDRATRNGFLTRQAHSQSTSLRQEGSEAAAEGPIPPVGGQSTRAYVIKEEEYRREGLVGPRFSHSMHDALESDADEDEEDSIMGGVGDDDGQHLGRFPRGHRRRGSSETERAWYNLRYSSRDSTSNGMHLSGGFHASTDGVMDVGGGGASTTGAMVLTSPFTEGMVGSQSPQVPPVPQLFPPSSPPNRYGSLTKSSGATSGVGSAAAPTTVTTSIPAFPTGVFPTPVSMGGGSPAGGSMYGGGAPYMYGYGGGAPFTMMSTTNSNSGSCNPSPRTNTSTATSLSRCHLSRKDDNFHGVPRALHNGGAVQYGTPFTAGPRFTPRASISAQSMCNSPRSLYRPGSYYSNDANSFYQEGDSGACAHGRTDSLGCTHGGASQQGPLQQQTSPQQPHYFPNPQGYSGSDGRSPSTFYGQPTVNPNSSLTSGPTSGMLFGVSATGNAVCTSAESLSVARGPGGCNSCPSCLLDVADSQPLSPRCLADSEGTTPRLALPVGVPRAMASSPQLKAAVVNGATDGEAGGERRTGEDTSLPPSNAEKSRMGEEEETPSRRLSVGPPPEQPADSLFTRRRYLTGVLDASKQSATTAQSRTRYVDPMASTGTFHNLDSAADDGEEEEAELDILNNFRSSRSTGTADALSGHVDTATRVTGSKAGTRSAVTQSRYTEDEEGSDVLAASAKRNEESKDTSPKPDTGDDMTAERDDPYDAADTPYAEGVNRIDAETARAAYQDPNAAANQDAPPVSRSPRIAVSQRRQESRSSGSLAHSAPSSLCSTVAAAADRSGDSASLTEPSRRAAATVSQGSIAVVSVIHSKIAEKLSGTPPPSSSTAQTVAAARSDGMIDGDAMFSPAQPLFSRVRGGWEEDEDGDSTPGTGSEGTKAAGDG